MFYVEDDYEAVISKRIWECVQLEIERRKNIWRSMGQTPIPTGRRVTRLIPKWSAKLGGEVHRIHGWGVDFDGDGYRFHAEDAESYQGL